MLDEREKLLAQIIPLGVSGNLKVIEEILNDLSEVHLGFPLDFYRATYTYISDEERVRLLKISEGILLRKLLSLATEIDRRKQELLDFYQATLLERLGDYWKEFDVPRARELYKVAAKIFNSRGDFFSQARTLVKLGDLLGKQDPNSAIGYYLKAKEIFSSFGYHLEEKEVKRKLYRLLKSLGKLNNFRRGTKND